MLRALVYELYFPEELHAAGLRLFDLVEQSVEGAARPLPSVEGAARPLASVGGAARPSSSDQQGQAAPSTFLPTLRAKFEELYDARHPLKLALEKLQTLDTVRIIEGKA